MPTAVLVTFERRSSLMSLLSKMSRPGSGGGGWFPFKTASLILLILIYYIIDQDIKINKGFEKSKTGIFLKDVGLDQTAVSYYNYYAEKGRDLRDWAEETAPIVQAKAVELRVKAEPYLVKAKTAVWNAYVWFVEVTKLLVLKIEEYIPGAQKKLNFYWEETVKLSTWAFERACHYALIGAKVLADLLLAAWQVIQETFNRIAKSDDKLNESMVIAKGAYEWTSLRAGEAAQWMQSQMNTLKTRTK